MRGNAQRRTPQVPTTTQVIPGAAVNIVLKADQPNGRTVSGTVRDVLTRGNHPRGIKVRLSDGRVGRVQSIVTAGSAAAAAAAEAHVPADPLLPDGDQLDQSSAERGVMSRARGFRGRNGEDEGEFLPPQEVALDAYIIAPAKPRGRRKRGDEGGDNASGKTDTTVRSQETSASSSSTGSVRCPVCDAFEGDEAAVAHHVAMHFDP